MNAFSPRIAAQVASVLFWSLGRPAAVRAADLKVHEAATVEFVRLNAVPVATYSWGTGKATALLVHGWRSRASRFSQLVRALEDSGHKVVSFDAPGHGASGKGRSDVIEWARIIQELEARHGRFDLIIGHSFGALAAFHSIRIGVATGRVVTIAGVHSLEDLVTTFTRMVKLPPRAQHHFRRLIDRRVFDKTPFERTQVVSQFDEASTSIPLLVVHDSQDPIVNLDQALLIADAHAGPVSSMHTAGLGHNRILADLYVVKAVTRFASIPVAD